MTPVEYEEETQRIAERIRKQRQERRELIYREGLSRDPVTWFLQSRDNDDEQEWT